MTSPITISSLPFITPSALAALLRSSPNPTKDIRIIDVRDTDFIGGHIRGCANHPVSTHDVAIPELARTLRDVPVVVFHCALSQQRGPASALRYVRERTRMFGEDAGKVLGKEGGTTGGQRVVVLEGGFSRWQELYGEDEQLTEGYQKDLWEYGY